MIDNETEQAMEKKFGAVKVGIRNTACTVS